MQKARNIKLTLQYDGSQFCGLEIQKNGPSIRAEIEKALFKIFARRIKITATSRTDAGVHACCQMVNFLLSHTIETAKIPAALNSALPDNIRIIQAQVVPLKFNARYAAKHKEYEYLVFNGEVLPPFIKAYVWHLKMSLDLPAMRRAAKILCGRHDFSSFCAANSDDKNFTRTLYSIAIKKKAVKIWDGNDFSVISFRFKGKGFLYKMVRNLVGTLAMVGMGKITLKQVKAILAAKNRRVAGPTAPAQGLCLTHITF